MSKVQRENNNILYIVMVQGLKLFGPITYGKIFHILESNY
jgi:hypothetical protein